MPYCALADILADLPEAELLALVDDEAAGSLDGPRLERVEAAMAEAGTVVDAHVRGRYPNLDPVPDILKVAARDLAVYVLHRRRFRTAVPDSIRHEHNTTIRLLEAVRDGRLTLGPAESGRGPGVYRTNKSPADRKFNRDTLDRF